MSMFDNIIKWEWLRLVRATWDGSKDKEGSGAGNVSSVVDEGTGTTECNMSVPVTRNAFEAELAGCWNSTNGVVCLAGK